MKLTKTVLAVFAACAFAASFAVAEGGNDLANSAYTLTNDGYAEDFDYYAAESLSTVFGKKIAGFTDGVSETTGILGWSSSSEDDQSLVTNASTTSDYTVPSNEAFLALNTEGATLAFNFAEANQELAENGIALADEEGTPRNIVIKQTVQFVCSDEMEAGGDDDKFGLFAFKENDDDPTGKLYIWSGAYDADQAYDNVFTETNVEIEENVNYTVTVEIRSFESEQIFRVLVAKEGGVEVIATGANGRTLANIDGALAFDPNANGGCWFGFTVAHIADNGIFGLAYKGTGIIDDISIADLVPADYTLTINLVGGEEILEGVSLAGFAPDGAELEDLDFAVGEGFTASSVNTYFLTAPEGYVFSQFVTTVGDSSVVENVLGQSSYMLSPLADADYTFTLVNANAWWLDPAVRVKLQNGTDAENAYYNGTDAAGTYATFGNSPGASSVQGTIRALDENFWSTIDANYAADYTFPSDGSFSDLFQSIGIASTGSFRGGTIGFVSDENGDLVKYAILGNSIDKTHLMVSLEDDTFGDFAVLFNTADDGLGKYGFASGAAEGSEGYVYGINGDSVIHQWYIARDDSQDISYGEGTIPAFEAQLLGTYDSGVAGAAFRSIAVVAIDGVDVIYTYDKNSKKVYATSDLSTFVELATVGEKDINDIRVVGVDSGILRLYVNNRDGNLYIFDLAADGMSVIGDAPVAVVSNEVIAAVDFGGETYYTSFFSSADELNAAWHSATTVNILEKAPEDYVVCFAVDGEVVSEQLRSAADFDATFTFEEGFYPVTLVVNGVNVLSSDEGGFCAESWNEEEGYFAVSSIDLTDIIAEIEGYVYVNATVKSAQAVLPNGTYTLSIDDDDEEPVEIAAEGTTLSIELGTDKRFVSIVVESILVADAEAGSTDADVETISFADKTEAERTANYELALTVDKNYNIVVTTEDAYFYVKFVDAAGTVTVGSADAEDLAKDVAKRCYIDDEVTVAVAEPTLELDAKWYDVTGGIAIEGIEGIADGAASYTFTAPEAGTTYEISSTFAAELITVADVESATNAEVVSWLAAQANLDPADFAADGTYAATLEDAYALDVPATTTDFSEFLSVSEIAPSTQNGYLEVTVTLDKSKKLNAATPINGYLRLLGCEMLANGGVRTFSLVSENVTISDEQFANGATATVKLPFSDAKGVFFSPAVILEAAE